MTGIMSVQKACGRGEKQPGYYFGRKKQEIFFGVLPARWVERREASRVCIARHLSRKIQKYVLKMDIRHFFDSVPHDVLKAKLSKHIHDELMLDLLFKIIDTTDEGIPLGFHTSQWLATLELAKSLGVTEELKARNQMK